MMKATSSTPNLQATTANKKYQQSIIEAKQYLNSIHLSQNQLSSSPNFIKRNIELSKTANHADNEHPTDLQSILDFVERTRRKIGDY